jgi:hypothetical protein
MTLMYYGKNTQISMVIYKMLNMHAMVAGSIYIELVLKIILHEKSFHQ